MRNCYVTFQLDVAYIAYHTCAHRYFTYYELYTFQGNRYFICFVFHKILVINNELLLNNFFSDQKSKILIAYEIFSSFCMFLHILH